MTLAMTTDKDVLRRVRSSTRRLRSSSSLFYITDCKDQKLAEIKGNAPLQIKGED